MATRVLWLTKGLGPGGAERLLVESARRLDHDRFEVAAAYVLPWKDHLADELEAAGVRTICLSQRDPDPTWPLALRRLLDGVDVVHAHSPVPAAAARLAARTLPRRRRPHVVSTEHNTWTSHRRATRWANRLTCGLDAATFAVTDEARTSMSPAAARRTEVLTHGVDVAAIAERSHRSRGRVRDELGIRGDEPVIVTVANLRPQKDYPNLLAASRRLADRGVRFVVLAVGQGPLDAELRRRVGDLGLDDRVRMLGYRPDPVEVLGAADVFVLASAWEGLPVAVMEALAAGLPVVATAVGGLTESLDARCAVLVPPRDPAALADALELLLTDHELRATLATGARDAADRFDVTRIVERTMRCYEDLARSSPLGGRGARLDHGPPRTPPSGPRSRSGGDEIRPMLDTDRGAVIELLRDSLGWADDDTSADLFAWKHVDNPFGSSAAWVAVDHGEPVAVRLFMRWRFRRGTATLPVVRAVDTATRPGHRGRGLFTALTLAAVDQCRSEGTAWVFNTPNAESRAGYLKMGWRDVGRLRAAVRPTRGRDLPSILRARVAADRWSLPLDVGADISTWLDRPPLAGRGDRHVTPTSSTTDRTLRTDADERYLRWRYGLAGMRYRVVSDGDVAIVVRLRRRGTTRELVVAERFGDIVAADGLAGRVAEDVGATHALRLGPGDPVRGFLPLPGGGPVLTWRALADQGPPPLPNWDLCMGDVELF